MNKLLLSLLSLTAVCCAAGRDVVSLDFDWRFVLGDPAGAQAPAFDGVYMNSEVWLDGHPLGRRPSGYISFGYDLTPHLRPGRNLLAVRVDNSREPLALGPRTRFALAIAAMTRLRGQPCHRLRRPPDCRRHNPASPAPAAREKSSSFAADRA